MSLSEGVWLLLQGMRKLYVYKKVEIWLYVYIVRHISLFSSLGKYISL